MLVIIGLIIGGILVGQDLINAAAIRAQIAQIDKYNTAVRTFQIKFNALPGDMNAATATAFGFAARGNFAGEGDGNGVIEGVLSDAPGQNYGYYLTTGEEAMFWVDLSQAGLIEGSFTTASANTLPGSDIPSSGLGLYMPEAKLGRGNYVYVWSGGWNMIATVVGDGNNYFGIQAFGSLFLRGVPPAPVRLTMSVQQAYNIDKKLDDGLPMSGNVMALYVSAGNYMWAGDGTYLGGPNTIATAGSSTTRFDNSATSNGSPGVAGAVQHYSLEINGGTGPNCALAFKFQ